MTLRRTNVSQAPSGLSPLPAPSFPCVSWGTSSIVMRPRLWIIPHMDIEALKKLSKNKKLVKKLAKKYDAFLASESLIKHIPRIPWPDYSFLKVTLMSRTFFLIKSKLLFFLL